jgi:SulP family sulfate permease
MPKAATAGVLYIVAAGIIDVAAIRTILRASRSDSAVLIITFLATVLLSLDFAIVLGVVASLVVYLHKAGSPRVLARVPDPRRPKRHFSTDPELPECPQVKIITIDGALFFGAANYVAERLAVLFRRSPGQRHLLILARTVTSLDVAGAQVLAHENRQRKALGGGIYLHQLNEPAKRILRRGGYAEEIGEDHFYDSKGEAIAGIFERLDRSICSHCSKRIFNECKMVPRADQPAREWEQAEPIGQG